MSFNFIKKFKVQLAGSGQYGKSKTLQVFDGLDDAIEWVKEHFDVDDENISVAVVEYRYASEENLKKDFSFDSHYRWATYF